MTAPLVDPLFESNGLRRRFASIEPATTITVNPTMWDVENRSPS